MAAEKPYRVVLTLTLYVDSFDQGEELARKIVEVINNDQQYVDGKLSMTLNVVNVEGNK